MEYINKQGIDAEFKGEIVRLYIIMSFFTYATHHINFITQDEWRLQVTKELEEVCKRPVLFRNKPDQVMNGEYRY